MLQNENCPVCESELTSEHLCGETLVCRCGWTKSLKQERLEKKAMDRTVWTMIAMCCLFVAGFIHAVNWDQYALEIVPLKLKQIAGSANSNELERIVFICDQRAKQDCVEQAYRDLVKLDQDPEHSKNLAQILYAKGDMSESQKLLQKYLEKGGSQVEAQHTYALTLSETGQGEQAIAEFMKILKSKPNTFQVSVTRDYVKTLIKFQKLEKAKATIEFYRKTSVSSSLFMDKEYKELQSLLKTKSRKIARNQNQ